MCEAPATARRKRARGAVMAITVRRLFADDWRESRAIRLEALRTFPGNYFTSLAEAEARGDDVWRGMLMSATLASFGLFDGERLVGITAIEATDRDTASLAMSYLSQPYRGRGLSAMLYAPRLDWARAKGVRRVLASHRATNEPSRRAMLRHGFRHVGAAAHRWPDGTVEDDVRYVLDLA